MLRSTSRVAALLGVLAPLALHAELTLAFRQSVTPYPGTTTPIAGELGGYALHDGGVVMVTRMGNTAPNRNSLLRSKNDQLSILLNETNGFPGGGDIYKIDLAASGPVVFLDVAKAAAGNLNSSQYDALLRLEAGTLTTLVADSRTLRDTGNLAFSFSSPLTAAAGTAAFVGLEGIHPHYLMRHNGTAATLLAQESVTPQPNGTGTGRFTRFVSPRLSPDGKRLFFDGYNAVNASNPDHRSGLYVEENGLISRVVDNTTLVPGTTRAFDLTLGKNLLFSANGAHTLLLAGSVSAFSATPDNRHGIYRVAADGALTTVVDSATQVDGATLTGIGESGCVVTDDGAVFFFASRGNDRHLYRAHNDTVTLFQRGDVEPQLFSNLWLHGSDLYLYAYDADFNRILYRCSTDAAATPVPVLDLSSHTLFSANSIIGIADLQFADGQVLIKADTASGGPALFHGLITDLAASSSTSHQSHAPAAGGSATLTASGGTAATYQWTHNGATVTGATSASLALAAVQPADTGIYTAHVTAANITTTQHAIVGLSSNVKALGAASEFDDDITHQNGNVYDQLLLEGAAASFTADPQQITRLSFVDLHGDIVQVEFSGAGTVSIVLDGATAPAPAANYNQPGINYVTGHAGIVVTGANETSNLSVFSVGRITAVNQSLFRDDVTYDGMADLAFVAIASTNGKFGGLRTANASYFAAKGLTGVYAPGVAFTGPVYVGDIRASDDATPVLMIGSAATTLITGGDLAQSNSRPVQVSGLTQLQFVAGSTSHGGALPAQTNQATLQENGTDVTTQIVVNPTP